MSKLIISLVLSIITICYKLCLSSCCLPIVQVTSDKMPQHFPLQFKNHVAPCHHQRSLRVTAKIQNVHHPVFHHQQSRARAYLHYFTPKRSPGGGANGSRRAPFLMSNLCPYLHEPGPLKAQAQSLTQSEVK